jgi:monofunctional biosynthetic peptidoglycan transglycosylase
MVLGLVVAAFAGCTRLPDVSLLKTQYPAVQYHGPKQPFTVALQKTRPGAWVSLGEISKAATGAIVVSEDWAFYTHKGIDPKQIHEALQEDLEAKTFARGASTITQQVVKNVFLSQEKSIARKVKEIILALRIEKTVEKKKILESYLNIAEWGEGTFGITAAARFYFGKSPAELSAKEGAFLAMLLPSPKRYSQSFRQKRLTDFAKKTVDAILSKMVKAHYLSEEDRAFEAVRPLSFENVKLPTPVQIPGDSDDEDPVDVAPAEPTEATPTEGAPEGSAPSIEPPGEIEGHDLPASAT